MGSEISGSFWCFWWRHWYVDDVIGVVDDVIDVVNDVIGIVDDVIGVVDDEIDVVNDVIDVVDDVIDVVDDVIGIFDDVMGVVDDVMNVVDDVINGVLVNICSLAKADIFLIVLSPSFRKLLINKTLRDFISSFSLFFWNISTLKIFLYLNGYGATLKRGHVDNRR